MPFRAYGIINDTGKDLLIMGTKLHGGQHGPGPDGPGLLLVYSS